MDRSLWPCDASGNRDASACRHNGDTRRSDSSTAQQGLCSSCSVCGVGDRCACCDRTVEAIWGGRLCPSAWRLRLGPEADLARCSGGFHELRNRLALRG
eukprot:6208488-Pleurochrysis_carterae.AAC.1